MKLYFMYTVSLSIILESIGTVLYLYEVACLVSEVDLLLSSNSTPSSRNKDLLNWDLVVFGTKGINYIRCILCQR